MVADLVAVVGFGIFVILLVVLSVAFTRATRLARRPAQVIDPRPEGFRYSFYGLIANLIAGAPTNSAEASSSASVDSDASEGRRQLSRRATARSADRAHGATTAMDDDEKWPWPAAETLEPRRPGARPAHSDIAELGPPLG